MKRLLAAAALAVAALSLSTPAFAQRGDFDGRGGQRGARSEHRGDAGAYRSGGQRSAQPARQTRDRVADVRRDRGGQRSGGQRSGGDRRADQPRPPSGGQAARDSRQRGDNAQFSDRGGRAGNNPRQNAADNRRRDAAPARSNDRSRNVIGNNPRQNAARERREGSDREAYNDRGRNDRNNDRGRGFRNDDRGRNDWSNDNRGRNDRRDNRTYRDNRGSGSGYAYRGNDRRNDRWRRQPSRGYYFNHDGHRYRARSVWRSRGVPYIHRHRYRWGVGYHYPYDYRRYIIIDYWNYYLPPPPPYHVWVCHDDGAYLISLATGIIVGLAIADDYYY